MNFSLTEDQILLRDTISKYLMDNYEFEQREKYLRAEASSEEDLWAGVAELGLLSIPFPESLGGFAGGPIDLYVLFNELGKHLVVEPFLETLILSGGILKRIEKGEKYTDDIQQLITGELQCSLALEDVGIAYSTNSSTTSAVLSADGNYILNGKKAVVYNADKANRLIVSAQLPDKEFALFYMPSDIDGCSMNSYSTIDEFTAAEVSINNVSLDDSGLMAKGEEAKTIVSQTIADAIVATSAEQLGMMEKLLSMTVDYSAQRKQFGVPINSFQVLQHKMANMYADIELAKSLLYVAAISLQEASDNANALIHALKVKVDKCAKTVAHEAFQIHGAIATTHEYPVGHYLKRITTLGQMFGGTDFHLRAYADLSSGVQISATNT